MADIRIRPASGLISVTGSATFQGSGSTIVQVQGSQGQLFSVTDSLTGTLMSVNDISGLPVLEVFDNDKVVAGAFGQNTLVVTGSRVGIKTGAPSAELDIVGNLEVNGNIVVTGTVDGRDVAADGSKLDGIASGANNYSLPTATASVLGGIKVGNNLSISNGVLSSTDTNTVTSVGISGDLSTGNIEFRGSGATSVTKSGGTITISSTDTNTNTVTSVGISGDLSTGNITLAGAGATTISKSGGTITISSTDTNTNTVTSVGISGDLSTGNITLVGSGATSVSKSGGTITITSTDTNTTYSNATTSVAGLMSTADKTKLDGIAASANNYSLPTATASVLGGIKVGNNLSISNGVLSSTDTNTVTSVGISGDLSTGNVEFRGAGATTVTKSGGTITITSTDTDTNTTYSAGTGLTLSGTTFSVTAGTYAAASHTHDDRYYTETEIDEITHHWQWRWIRWAGFLGPAGGSAAQWTDYYKTYFTERSTATEAAYGEQGSGYVNTITNVNDEGGFGGSTYGNIFGNLESYHCLIYTNIYVDKAFTVSVTDFNGDDPHAIFVDGVFVHGNTACCVNTAYSYTFTQGWHRIDLIYSEGGGGDWIRMGWNPKNYTSNIKDVTPHRGGENPRNVFDKIKALDGAGSGLDADTLDGNQATAFAASSHTHAISDVTGLQSALDGKQAAGSYAAASHTHAISDVTGLQSALDGKQAAGSYAAASHTHSAATTSAAGFMSATDKTKLDGIAASANNYSLPLATSSVRGGVRIGYTANGKNYPVQLSSEQMYVNVPWTDTDTNTVTSVGVSGDLSTGNVEFRGSGATSISKSGGTITISSTDTNTTYSAGTGLTLSGTTFSVTSGTYVGTSGDQTVAGVKTFSGKVIITGRSADSAGSFTNGYLTERTGNTALELHSGNDEPVTIYFKSTVNAPSDFGYITFDPDLDNSGENAAMIIGVENDGAGSSDYIRLQGRTVVDADYVSSEASRIMEWQYQGANRGYIDTSGNLTVTGDVTGFSDARVKTNVETIENALDKVTKLRGVTFNRTDIDDTRTKIGVIAQEVKEVLPEVVTENESGIHSVAYGNIVGVLIEAIKEQQKQIEQLKATVDGLTK